MTNIVVDLGKQTTKKIKKLRKGKGPLPAKLDAAIREAKARLGDKSMIPVVLLYEKKAKRKTKGLPFFGPF